MVRTQGSYHRCRKGKGPVAPCFILRTIGERDHSEY